MQPMSRLQVPASDKDNLSFNALKIALLYVKLRKKYESHELVTQFLGKAFDSVGEAQFLSLKQWQ